MELTRDELSKKIGDLIKSGNEGKTWDFKAKWYAQGEKSELVKDIICMANNPTPNDAYIIIGVDEKTKKPLDDYCLKNDPSRKSEEDLISILSSDGVKFANNNIPEVRLETVHPVAYEFEVDVIIIGSTSRVPYYLTKVYKTGKKETGKIESNTIYVRRGSRNSKAGSKAAVFPEIEALWKKRFGLDLSIMDRFELLLSDEDGWDLFKADDSDKDYFDLLKTYSSGYIYISKSCPDFTIRISECGDLPYLDPVGWFYTSLIEWLPPYILGIDVFPADELPPVAETRRVCDVLAGCGCLNLFFKEFKLWSSYFDAPGVRYCDDLDTLLKHPRFRIETLNMRFLRPKLDSVYAYFYVYKKDMLYNINSLLRNITEHEFFIFPSEEINKGLNDLEEWLFKRYVICFEYIEEKDEFDKYLKEYFIKKFRLQDSFTYPRGCIDMLTTDPYEMKFSYCNRIRQLNKDSLTEALEHFMEHNKAVIDSQMVSNFIKVGKNHYINDFMLNIFIVKHFEEWKKNKGQGDLTSLVEDGARKILV